MNDQPVNIEQASTSSGDSTDAPEKRERSTVEFPYNDLDDAVGVASSLQQFAGSSVCDMSELAAHMGMAASGGGFRLKIAAARIFGLAQSESRGKIQITSLGNQILKPETEQNARVTAFLGVELYGKLYESRKGHALPVAAALEREVVSLGVPPKQKAKARQVFERSAQQAGFIQQGTERFVRPPLSSTNVDQGNAGTDPNSGSNAAGSSGSGGSGGGGNGDLHPFIAGLLGTLPEPETVWPIDKREEWLNAAKQIFKLIYKEPTAPPPPPPQTGDGNTDY